MHKAEEFGARRIRGERRELPKERKELYSRWKTVIGNTPLVDVGRWIEVPNGNTVLAKMEMSNKPTGSHYDRVYFPLLEEMESKGVIVPGVTPLIEVSSGNATPAFSFACSVLGYEAHCVLPNEISETRKRLSWRGILHHPDPTTDYISKNAHPIERAVHCLQRIYYENREKGMKCPNHAQMSSTVLAMSRMADEIRRWLAEKKKDVETIIGAMGNGSTLLTLAAVPHEKFIAYYTSSFVPGLNSPDSDFDFPFMRAAESSISERVLVSDDEWVATGKKLVEAGGPDIGKSSAISLHLALKEAEKHPDRTILIVFYDSADRY